MTQANVVDPAAVGVARRARGFSLVEVAVASALFLITIAGVLTAVGATSNLYAHQRKMTTAIHVGERMTEELLLRFSGAPDIQAGTYTQGFDEAGEPTAASEPPFVARWVVSEVPNLTALRSIVVNVGWTEGGAARSIQLQTYRP